MFTFLKAINILIYALCYKLLPSSMSKFFLNFLVLCFFNVFFLYVKVVALDEGVYTGIYKVFYAHPDSDARKGDKGVFEFKIKDDKVINLFAYDEPNWKLYGIRTSFKINPETNELEGYASGSDPSGSVPVRFKINMKGVFV